jgi:hypothetical protein
MKNLKEGITMSTETNRSYAVIFSVTVILISFIVALCIYGLNERKLMASNIENAIGRGIDPLSVRCSYARGDDIICVTHAAAGTRFSSR